MKKSGKAVVAVLLCIVLSGSGLYTVEASGGETSKKNDEKYSELQNRLPEMLTGMDENGDVYSVDTESGIVENGQSKARTAEAKVVNFNTKGFSDTTTYTEVETGNSGYTCGAYGADAAYLGTNGTKVRFMSSRRNW